MGLSEDGPGRGPASKPQKAKAPYGIRPLLAGWRALYFHQGPLKPAPGLTPEQQRGRYLSEAVVHCQECHSPRNGLGAIEVDKAYAGNPKGPDDQDAPNITPTAIGKLTQADLQEMLKTGMTPDGDYLASGMGQVIEGTSKMTQADRDAIIAYIRTLPPQAFDAQAAEEVASRSAPTLRSSGSGRSRRRNGRAQWSPCRA